MNKSDLTRNGYMLIDSLANKGYDWWWNSLMGLNRKTEEKRAFFIEYFIVNPALGTDEVIYRQMCNNTMPSYVMVKAGAWGNGKKQLHVFYPLSQMKILNSPIKLAAGECKLSEKHMSGTGTGRIKLYRKQKGEKILVDDMKFEDAGCEYGEYTF